MSKKPFDLIVADPPWKFKTYSKKGLGRSADQHYNTMSAEDIDGLPTLLSLEGIEFAENCLLFLWATSPMLQDAFCTLSAWEFDYKSSFVWDKEIAGTGYWTRNQHEYVLISTRGKFKAPEPKHRIPSVIRSRRGRHSEKPEYLQDWIDKAYPDAKTLELFARRKRPGWTVWGNEV